jgi:hypothetical protein
MFIGELYLKKKLMILYVNKEAKVPKNLMRHAHFHILQSKVHIFGP